MKALYHTHPCAITHQSPDEAYLTVILDDTLTLIHTPAPNVQVHCELCSTPTPYPELCWDDQRNMCPGCFSIASRGGPNIIKLMYLGFYP